MARVPKALSEGKYFRQSTKDKTELKYMKKFYRQIFKAGRSKPFTLRRMTLYTCQYVFPPNRGYPKGRPCIDDVYGLPDPDCPACNGTGHPVKGDKYRDVRVMGFLAPMGDETESPRLVGMVNMETKKLLVGLPVPPNYTALVGLKPKTDILDKNGQIIERDVFIGYKLEIDDIIIWQEEFWDGYVNRTKTTAYLIVGFMTPAMEQIGYFRLFQVALCNVINAGNVGETSPEPRFDRM